MKPWYAVGARQLLEERQRKLMPGGPVAVVLTGNTELGRAIYVKADMPLERLDWRMLVDLQVHLIASAAVPLRSLLRVARDIAGARPKRLTVRFDADGASHDVDVGHGLHQAPIDDIPPIHAFTWTPMDLTLTETGAKLRRALLGELPMWSTL